MGVGKEEGRGQRVKGGGWPGRPWSRCEEAALRWWAQGLPGPKHPRSAVLENQNV